MPVADLRSLQMRVLLHQLLQSESRELYRNLSGFSFTLSTIDDSFAILRVFHPLSGPESMAACGLLHRYLGAVELLTTRSKKVGNIVDRIVFGAGIPAGFRLGWGSSARRSIRGGHRALIFIFIAVVPVSVIVAGMGR